MEKPGRIILIVLGIAVLVGLYFYKGSKITSEKRNRETRDFQMEQQTKKIEKKVSQDIIQKLEGKIKWDMDEWYGKLHDEKYQEDAIEKLDYYIPKYRSRIEDVMKEAKEKHCNDAIEKCESELKRLERMEKEVDKLRW